MVRIRAAALVIRGRNVLLARHRREGITSFLFPGGGVESGESARDALVREMREEAGVDVTVGDLRYVVEALAPNGARHIVQLLFDVDFVGEVGPSADARVAACEWHDVRKLRSLPIHPAVGAVVADDVERTERPTIRYVLAPWIK